MTKNYCERFIEEIKLSSYNNIIYGADILAGKIYDYLMKNHVSVEGFLVDDDYWSEGKSFKGEKVYSLTKYLKNNKANIVMGFTKLSDEKIKELKSNNNVMGLFAYDFLGAFVLDIDDLNIFEEDFWNENSKEFQLIKEKFEDEISRESFDLYVDQKRNGTYRKEYCLNKQYFDDEIIKLDDNEVVLDCGAYRGENYLDYLDSCKKQGVIPGKVYCFEPDHENIQFLNKLSDQNMEVMPYGVWDENITLYFSDNQGTNTRVSENGETKIDVVAIDKLGLEKVTFIKMDVEGSELKALHGAEKTIKSNKPKLAICVYHKKEDLITIPQYILSLRPDYKIYLRNYASSGVETVIYAI